MVYRLTNWTEFPKKMVYSGELVHDGAEDRGEPSSIKEGPELES